jgi:O-acetyl-ADP-ribose deacetylase
MLDRIELVKGDITKLEIEVIVNAANSQLSGGGGVDGAIHKAGGSKIHQQCMRLIQKNGQLPVGESVITESGNMPCRFVIHTVGPIWKGGENDESALLTKAYRSSLELANDFSLKEVAFPNISTGIYGFPKEKAAEIVFKEVCNFLHTNLLIKKVVFVCYDDENYKLYEEQLEKLKKMLF